MIAMILTERLLQMEPRSGSQRTKARTSLPATPPGAAEAIVEVLLGDVKVSEATVHRPRRGQVWVATFSGPTGGQRWKSTGLSDRDQALLVARKWEAEVRVQRARLGRAPDKPTVRVRRPETGAGRGLLTQKEVAQLLHMSERGVREVERRAFEKIRNHPLMRQVWQQYLAGELDEQQGTLTPEEVQALCQAARTSEECQLLRKVLRLIQC